MNLVDANKNNTYCRMLAADILLHCNMIKYISKKGANTLVINTEYPHT